VFHETLLLALLPAFRESMPTHDGWRRRVDSGEYFLQSGQGNEVLGYLPVRQKEMASSGQEEEDS